MIAPGTRLGPYDVIAQIGAGAMGEVYRARDLRLGREVAIKVLPFEFSSDPQRLQRFEQEARAAAALNHPNIVAVYDIGTHQGAPYIVSELLEGQTLRARIQDGPLPVRRAVDYAVQIARGLGVAHDRAIIHRDLKPENVFVTAGGGVKILDFGLAKLTQAPIAAAAVSSFATRAPDTVSGMVLGTVGYMAPEQVRGEAADHRADIFTFGVILYEMLSGTRAFHGDSAPETMTAILKQEPPELSSIQRQIPPALTRIVSRCFEKDPAARFRSMDDVAFALEALAPASHSDVRPAPSIGFRGFSLRTAAVLMTAGVIGIVVFLAMRPGPLVTAGATGVMRVELTLPVRTELSIQTPESVAISPDGTTVAFLGTAEGLRQVYVRRLSEFETVAIPGTDTAQTCMFSRDGRSIVFAGSDRVLKKVTLNDGLIVTMTRGVSYESGLSWTPDDRVVFTRDGVLWRIAASGGEATQISTLDDDKGEVMHGWPVPLENGAIVFGTVTRTNFGAGRIEALLRTGERRVLVEAGTRPVVAATGHLLFFRDNALLAAPLDLDSVELTGAPVRVAEGIAVSTLTGFPLVALSRTGTLLYPSNDAATSRVVWVRRDGAEVPMNDVARVYRNPRLSADQRTLVIEAGAHLWMQDIARGTFTRLTSDRTGGNSFPVITPDSTRVIFRTLTGMHALPIDGSGVAQPLRGSTSIIDVPNSVSPDGRTLVFLRQTADTSGDVYVMPLDGSADPRPLVSTPAYEGGGQFSPDGRWVVFASGESGRMEVYVRPFLGSDRKWLVSTDGGTHPMWSRKGDELFYRAGNRMMAVTVASDRDGLSFSPPRLLFEERYSFASNQSTANYDISVEGDRFVMVKDDTEAGRLNLVLNWFEELNRLVPTP